MAAVVRSETTRRQSGSLGHQFQILQPIVNCDAIPVNDVKAWRYSSAMLLPTHTHTHTHTHKEECINNAVHQSINVVSEVEEEDTTRVTVVVHYNKLRLFLAYCRSIASLFSFLICSSRLRRRANGAKLEHQLFSCNSRKRKRSFTAAVALVVVVVH